MERIRVYVKLGMVRLTVYLMTQRVIVSPVNTYVQEGKVVLSFNLHGEMSALVETVQVVKDILRIST